jgi:hypothetical protein
MTPRIGHSGRLAGAVLLSVLAALGPAWAQGAPVDLELAFVVDASGSIDDKETRLQRQGYADALTNPRVLEVVTGGLLGSVALAYIEFAAQGCERLSVPWTRIDGAESARAFGQAVLAQPTSYCPGGNAVGDALAFAARSLETNDFDGTRRVIDISGDGPNTLGAPVRPVRDLIVAAGITINGLVIERPTMPDLDLYFREAVTGGPGSFVIKAENRRAFGEAILKKLILEVAELPAAYR